MRANRMARQKITAATWACGLIWVCLSLAVATPLAAADKPFSGFAHDATQPVEIAADSLEVRRDDQIAVFTGKVEVRQGKARITAARMEVRYAGSDPSTPNADGNGGVSRVRAEGQVFMSNGAETAEGAWADYDVAGQVIRMGGGVVLTQGGNAITGDSLTIDLAKGNGKIDGGKADGGKADGGKGRVRSLFTPPTKSAKP